MNLSFYNSFSRHLERISQVSQNTAALQASVRRTLEQYEYMSQIGKRAQDLQHLILRTSSRYNSLTEGIEPHHPALLHVVPNKRLTEAFGSLTARRDERTSFTVTGFGTD